MLDALKQTDSLPIPERLIISKELVPTDPLELEYLRVTFLNNDNKSRPARIIHSLYRFKLIRAMSDGKLAAAMRGMNETQQILIGQIMGLAYAQSGFTQEFAAFFDDQAGLLAVLGSGTDELDLSDIQLHNIELSEDSMDFKLGDYIKQCATAFVDYPAALYNAVYTLFTEVVRYGANESTLSDIIPLALGTGTPRQTMFLNLHHVRYALAAGLKDAFVYLHHIQGMPMPLIMMTNFYKLEQLSSNYRSTVDAVNGINSQPGQES